MPSSSDGTWLVGGSNANNPLFNTIIQSVSEVRLYVDYTSIVSEIVDYDNICMTPGGCGDGNTDHKPPPPVVTGCLSDSKVTVTCNGDGTYTLTLDGTSFTGTDITLASETPGVTVTTPLQSWAPTTTWTLVGATAGQTVTLFATTTKFGAGSEKGTDLCCSGEIKIVMPDCPPPKKIDVGIDKEVKPVEGPINEFHLSVHNLGDPITFAANQITVTDNIPMGMTVTSVAGTGSDWTCNVPPVLTGAGQLICTYNLAGSAATNTQIGSVIVVHATSTEPGTLENCALVATDPAVGTDANLDNNKDCAKVAWQPQEGKIDLGIEKTGKTTPYPENPAYAFHLTVTNHGSALNGNGVIVVTDVVPVGMTFDAATGTDWLCNAPPPLGAGQTLTCTYTGTAPVASGAILGTIDIAATATGNPPYPPFRQCADVGLAGGSGLVDVDPSNDEACVTVEKQKQEIIDLGIGKTGDISSGPVGRVVDYTLNVTNYGAAFTGPGGVTVTDNVPSGVTITAASGTDWICHPVPITGPGTLTCDYTGTGTVATGASLGTIVLTGTTQTDGPFDNCADVGVDPSSGLSDSDAGNNEACVTVELPKAGIDLGVVKGGDISTTPGQVGYALNYTLKVTNYGASIVGTGGITVTDSVPAGETITAASGTDWLCHPVPITGPNTLTCDYTGSGTIGTGANFPTIVLDGTSRIKGPFNNCADVAVGPSSGFTDTNAGNNESCVTLSAPQTPVCDPKTTKLTGDSCACLYPRMNRTSQTTCGCIAGTKLIPGKGCEPVVVCKSPLVLGKDGRSCVCQGDLVLRNGHCVEQPVQLKCPLNMIPNRAGTACTCLPGMVKVGNACILRLPIPKPIPKPDDNGRGLPDNGAGGKGGAIKLPGR